MAEVISVEQNIPAGVLDAGREARKILSRGIPSRTESKRLSKARLLIAIWACRAEKIKPNRFNLAAVLGDCATESLKLFSPEMAENSGEEDGSSTTFWGD